MGRVGRRQEQANPYSVCLSGCRKAVALTSGFLEAESIGAESSALWAAHQDHRRPAHDVKLSREPE